ncbi:MAG: hypothetical protein J0L86_05690 [Flavobacteriales bacterium]|nr:hypothetical protein [Flavobacteriales bacterium]
MDSRLRGKDVKMTEYDWKKDNYKSLLKNYTSSLALMEAASSDGQKQRLCL